MFGWILGRRGRHGFDLTDWIVLSAFWALVVILMLGSCPLAGAVQLQDRGRASGNYPPKLHATFCAPIEVQVGGV